MYQVGEGAVVKIDQKQTYLLKCKIHKEKQTLYIPNSKTGQGQLCIVVFFFFLFLNRNRETS